MANNIVLRPKALALRSLLVTFLLCISAPLLAETASLADQIDRDQRNREEQKEIQERISDVIPPAQLPKSSEFPIPPIEARCFVVNNIEVSGAFVSLPNELSRHYIGQCIGKDGIALYLRAINKILLAKGYITARAALPQQDLSSGEFKIQILSGKLEEVIFPESYNAYWRHALPMEVGESLNIRDMEQAVDQLNRLSSQDIKFDIEPGLNPGTSKVVAKVKELKAFNGGISIDDAGSESTGIHQVSADFSYSNLFSIQEIITASITRDLDDNSDDTSRNYRVGLSLPYKYWLFDISANGSEYEQLVKGDVQSFVSSGNSNDEKLKATYVAYRDNKSKVSLYTGVRKRTRRGYINDAEIAVQRRNLTDLELGVLYRRYINRTVLDLSLSVYQGTDWLNAESKDNALDSSAPQPDYRYYTATAVMSHQAQWFSRAVQISTQFQTQWADTPIYSLDWFSNGGRYTVRGFSSEHSLSAEHGWRLKNDVTTQLFNWPISIYTGIDVGEVSGDGADDIKDKTLSGVALGIKGQIKAFNYDAFISRPFILNGTEKNNGCKFGARIAWRY
jgi:hemolysin activation/secretion protein